jgi:hypothetical protein
VAVTILLARNGGYPPPAVEEEPVTPGLAGKYSAKHPEGTRPDSAIVTALDEVTDEGRVSCAVAHDLADDLAVTPAAVGRTMDLLEYRIIKCQMGIFGYEPGKKIVKPAAAVSDELRDRLLLAAPQGRISCASCWKVAEALGIQKIAVAAACETLGLKIKPCQLGAF